MSGYSLLPLHHKDWNFDQFDSRCGGCGIKFRDPEDYTTLIRVIGATSFLHNTPACAKELFWLFNGSNPELAQNQYELWQIMEKARMEGAR